MRLCGTFTVSAVGLNQYRQRRRGQILSAAASAEAEQGRALELQSIDGRYGI